MGLLRQFFLRPRQAERDDKAKMPMRRGGRWFGVWGLKDHLVFFGRPAVG
jgi:hypothetical protein